MGLLILHGLPRQWNYPLAVVAQSLKDIDSHHLVGIVDQGGHLPERIGADCDQSLGGRLARVGQSQGKIECVDQGDHAIRLILKAGIRFGRSFIVSLMTFTSAGIAVRAACPCFRRPAQLR